ncbi:hypothetical protein F4811DRAFT_335235 [Daldinia bambusicola]|nr:hypothetical protein F4811DRAFT_335235 [Daldinia bambusicola]
MLSLHLKRESERWAAQRQSYPAPPLSSYSSSSESDCESIFSSTSTRSRRSSLSSEAPDDEPAPAPFQQPRDSNGAPIAIYASLEQAAAQSTQEAEAQGPRRLVTPGKLYENEEDDDEIVEWPEEQGGNKSYNSGGSNSVATQQQQQQHAESGFSRTVLGSGIIPLG